MPSNLALFLTLAVLAFLFWRESRNSKGESAASWIAFLWFSFSGSRFFSQWLSMFGVDVGASSLEDGSPIDRVVFAGLIGSGLFVLYRRRVQLSEFARQNVWLTIFLIYCFLAIFWSDFPFVAFKRWVKVVGHPIMILVILTEPNPEEAVRRLLKRCGFLLVALSLLLCKYFRQYGVAYNEWTGAQYFQGVTTAKNTLGNMCMVFAVFFFWNALQALRIKSRSAKLYELVVSAIFLGTSLWLIKMASSATSLVTALVGILMIGLLGLPFVNKRRFGIYFIAGIVLFAVANSMTDIYANVVYALGRNLTLTDRTNIWATVLRLQPDPLVGAGFESFWLGDRLEAVWSALPQEHGIGEAHNGYLETYLSLGLVGLVIFLLMLRAMYDKIRLDLLRQFEFGRLRMGLFMAILVHNFTEATFVSVHFLYVTLFLIGIDYRKVRRPRPQRVVDVVRREGENVMVSSRTQLG